MSTSMSEPIDLERLKRLHQTSVGRKILETELEFARGCIQLTAIVGCSLAQAQSVVSRIACESRAPINKLPAHILELIQNTWRVENAPLRERWRVELEYPTECSRGCLRRFYAYLEEEASNGRSA